MNIQGGENEIRYVFAVSPSNKKRISNKVNVENTQSDVVGNVIRCKKISRVQQIAEGIKQENRPGETELTIISTDESAMVIGNTLNSENNLEDEPTPKKQKSEFSCQRNTSKSKLMQLSNDHLTHSTVVTSYSHSSPTDNNDNDTEYVSLSTYRAKHVSDEIQERRQGKYKVFRDEWLDIDIFRDWLDRDPTNPRKARCIACNTTMNAGKSELEKHAAGARHERAVEEMMLRTEMIQQLVAADAEAEEHEVQVVDEEDSSNETSGQMHAVSISGTTQPIVMEQTLSPEETVSVQEQQLDAINRVATAVETLSTNVAVLVERLSCQQGELIAVLRALQTKICSGNSIE